MSNRDVHDRQPSDEEFESEASTTPRRSKASDKPKTAQETRDDHYFEDGVKADGSGGKPPEGNE